MISALKTGLPRSLAEGLTPPLLLALTLTGALAPTVLAHEPPAFTAPVAARITAENAERFRVGGMDAQGGIGDWFLTNGVLCAIVSAPTQESSITWQGGFLTDVGYCGKADDHFLTLYPAVNMDLRNALQIATIAATTSNGGAQIVTTGMQDGLQVTITYGVHPDLPDVIAIDTEIERKTSGAPLQRYGEVLLTAHSMPIYDVSIDRQTTSNGFSHVEDSPSPADLTVLLGRGDPGHDVAYGYWHLGSQLQRTDGQHLDLPAFDVSGHEYTARFALLGSDLAVGERLIHRGQILIAEGEAISPLTDRLWRNGPTVTGQAGEPDVVLLVEDAHGAPVTHAIAAADGTLSFRVPKEGAYRAVAGADGREPVAVDFRVAGTTTQLPALGLAPPARLALPAGQTMRLSFRRLDAPEDPNFIDAHFEHQVRQGDRLRSDGASRHVFLSGDATDRGVLLLAPGDYRITASRGPEFSVAQATLTLRGGEETRLEIDTPRQVLATPGYVSADFHVHSGRSFDTNLNTRLRVKSYVAQGAEVLVATEHDTLYDFTALIDAMGLAATLKTVTGSELTTELGNPVTPFGIGHANVFPLPEQPLMPRHGAPAHERHRWRDIFAGLRQFDPTPLVQLNHPRNAGDAGLTVGEYFSHLSVAGVAFDRYLPISTPPNSVMVAPDPATGIRDIDFDLIEIENGNLWGDRYRATRDDWFTLLRQGIRMVAAANSDSHGVTNRELAANVRNMVYTGSDNLAEYNERAFLDAIRSGNLYGTNGPMLAVTLNGTPIGGTASGSNPRLSLRADAADWLKVDRYEIYIDGVAASAGALTQGEELILPLAIERDAFVTVEVTGPTTELSREVIGDVPPFAFSNPIFYDADGDGRWTPVGTPLPRP